MRLWSLHPKYLDRAGLLALWREGLLAKKVLEGKTRGYRNHPQLKRFKSRRNPVLVINAFLREVLREAQARGYEFDSSKIISCNLALKVPVTCGQIKYEFSHLLKKLKNRDPKKYAELKKLKSRNINVNKIFKIIDGEIETWEKVKS